MEFITNHRIAEASNLVDFMDSAESTSALATMMDDRSNPETYMVSRVADRWGGGLEKCWVVSLLG